MRLLLLSNSTNAGSTYLAHAVDDLARHLEGVRSLAFVPYAAVRFGYDEYEARVQAVLGPMGIDVRSVHRSPDPATIVDACDAVAVGGGNTFHLLRAMYAHGLVAGIRERVRAGLPYVGWSAGSNVACPTIRTTNDMPIVEPPSLDALGLVPYQINPHYLDAHPDGHMGETREERLEEFIRANPGMWVVGLREGTALDVRDDGPHLIGPRAARIFRDGTTPTEVEPGSSLAFLLG